MSRAIRFAPLALLLLVIVALVWRLATPPDTDVHSALEGRPLPTFALPAILPNKPALSSADLATGQPRLLNVFASWCVPCVAEVKVQEGESIESALRRFKRKVQQEDIIKDIKKHSFYLKPGDKRRAKQALARKRNRKKMRRELE